MVQATGGPHVPGGQESRPQESQTYLAGKEIGQLLPLKTLRSTECLLDVLFNAMTSHVQRDGGQRR